MPSTSLTDLDLAAKTDLLDALRTCLEQDLAHLERSQADVQQGATHSESRSEHAKDTRATEQAYLARGLAERVEAARTSLDQIGSLPLRRFESNEPAGVTALVRIEWADTGESETWWLMPGAGGMTLEYAGHEVRTVIPGAPLGQALIGLEAGDEGILRSPRGRRDFEVLEVA